MPELQFGKVLPYRVTVPFVAIENLSVLLYAKRNALLAPLSTNTFQRLVPSEEYKFRPSSHPAPIATRLVFLE
mgnify:CR=1 FL=1